jgi:hypothetical protein
MCVVSLYVYLVNTFTAPCDIRRESVDQLKSHSVAKVCDSSDLEPVKDRMNVDRSSSTVLGSIAVRSFRRAPLGRARPRPVGLPCTPKVPARFCHVRRPATVDPQGFTFVKNPFVPTFDTILGPRGQTLNRIGETGLMVLRMRRSHEADAGPCRLQRRTREWVPSHFWHT